MQNNQYRIKNPHGDCIQQIRGGFVHLKRQKSYSACTNEFW